MITPDDLADQLTDLHRAPCWHVALSGGLDSVVLLHLLHRWCAAHAEAPPLYAIHIHHGLAAAADDWQAHCEDLCARLNVPLTCRRVEVEPVASLEAAAREVRYRAFESLLGPGDVVMLAHHLDDQVETFFLRLMRGAGVEGLAGMPASRPLGEGRLARPLLGLTRAQLEDYAAEHGLEAVDDPANADPRFDRSFLRHEILPLIRQRWPGYRRTVGRAASHLAGAATLLARELDRGVSRVTVTGDPGIALDALDGEAGAARLRGWLRLQGRRSPDHAPLAEFLRQLASAGADANPLLAWGDGVLQRFRDGVYLLPEAPGEAPDEASLAPGEALELPGVGLLALRPANGPGLRLDGRVTVRFRVGGENCRPLGRPASPLKKLLQQWQVPPWWRERLPLLYAGDELLAVADLALCESSRLVAEDEPGERWEVAWERPIQALRD